MKPLRSLFLMLLGRSQLPLSAYCSMFLATVVIVVNFSLPIHANIMSPDYIEWNKSNVYVESGDGRKYVKDAFFVTLQDELVEPPNPDNQPTLIGEHSSGQSKEELARTLGLNGEIVSIIETINVIVIQASEEEALRLSQDERVLRVRRVYVVESALGDLPDMPIEPDSGKPAGFPTYQNGTLTLPRIDTPEQISFYQNVTLQFDEQTGTCQLVDFNVKPSDENLVVTDVQVAVTEEFPAQVFLRMVGRLDDGCWILAQVNQRLIDNRFEVMLHSKRVTMENDACVAWQGGFEKILPLKVYDLDAGTYEYRINNGQHTGTFTLERDNKF